MHFDALNTSRWLSMVVLIGRDVIPSVITSTDIRHEIWMYPTQRTQWHCPQWKTILDMMSLLQNAKPSSEAAFRFHYHWKLFVCSEWKTYTWYLNVFFFTIILWVSLWCSLYFFQLCVYMYLMAWLSVYLQHAGVLFAIFIQFHLQKPSNSATIHTYPMYSHLVFSENNGTSSYPGPLPRRSTLAAPPSPLPLSKAHKFLHVPSHLFPYLKAM